MKRTIVITGGTRGIGQGMAREFLQRGHRVCITGRSQTSVDQGLAELQDAAGEKSRLLGVPCDVGQLDQVQHLWGLAVAAFGTLDIWINNAGIANLIQDFDDIEPEDYRAIVNTNLIGVFNGCRVALHGMKEQGHGQLYNFEGFGSDGRTGSGLSVYGTTKRAVTYFTETLIKENSEGPVNVGLLSPGIVVTRMILQEADHLPAERWEKTKRIYNIIGDKVDTVTPWLVENTLADYGKHGSRIAWLTTPKATGRFFGAFVLRKKRDLFSELGA